MDDHVRAGQVQSCPARFERDQEHRGPVRVEGAHSLDPGLLGRRACDLIIGNLLFFQLHFQKFQHSGELGEDQRLVLPADDAAHQFHAHFFLD